MYCEKCGNKIEDNSNFCSKCGTSVNKKDNERKIIYDGEVHKCPNCGEVLNSFIANCPVCGYELRNSNTSSSVKEFANKISNTKSEDECAKLVRNFPVPNNKEDILEFMILASSNITAEKSRKVFEAWIAKFGQCYQKSKMLFENDAAFDKIQNIYEETNDKIKKEKNVHNVSDLKSWLDNIMINPIFGVAIVFVLLYSLIRLFRGQFAGIDIIFDAIILLVVYKLTNKK